MGFKINHYAKPTDSDGISGWESILKDLSFGAICTVMAIFGWNVGSILLTVPIAIVGVMCYAAAFITVVTGIVERKKYDGEVDKE